MSLRLLLVPAAMVVLMASCGDRAPTDDAATAVAVATTRPTSALTDPTTTPPSSTITAPTTMTPRRAEASCAFGYNATTLAERTWAFDGTLIEVGTGQDSQLGSTPSATFAVNQWYRGGTGEQVTVQYEMATADETAPVLEPGARLLVAGEPRWDGAPLDDPVAWGCGFTQTWTSEAAQTWTDVFNV